jgi:hypothetical protein
VSVFERFLWRLFQKSKNVRTIIQIIPGIPKLPVDFAAKLHHSIN